MRAADLFLWLFLHLQYVLWYTHNMMVSKKKVMTKKKKISPVLIFFLTLGGILLVGLSGLLFLSLQTGKEERSRHGTLMQMKTAGRMIWKERIMQKREHCFTVFGR